MARPKKRRLKLTESELEWEIKERERLKKRRKEYYQKNKEKIAAQNKKWRENNKEKQRNILKRYRESHKELTVSLAAAYNNRKVKDPLTGDVCRYQTFCARLSKHKDAYANVMAGHTPKDFLID